MFEIKKAVAKKQNLRMAIAGPPGAGKTMTALKLAKHLGQRVLVIDTERESSTLYAGLNDEIPDFDFVPLFSYDCAETARFINSQSGSYDVLIIDSGSHFWEGTDGILDSVSKRGNSQQAWGAVKVAENAFMASILDFAGHVITTYRTANEYDYVEDAKGKKNRQRVGFKAKTREGMEYEYTVTAYMNDENTLTIEKTRFDSLTGKSFRKPGKELATILLAECARGVGGEQELSDTIKRALLDVTDKATLAKWLSDYTQPIKTLSVTASNKIRAEYKIVADRINATITSPPSEDVTH